MFGLPGVLQSTSATAVPFDQAALAAKLQSLANMQNAAPGVPPITLLSLDGQPAGPMLTISAPQVPTSTPNPTLNEHLMAAFGLMGLGSAANGTAPTTGAPQLTVASTPINANE